MRTVALVLLIAIFSSNMLISNEQSKSNYIFKKMQKDEQTKVEKINKLKPKLFNSEIALGLLKEKPKTPNFEAISNQEQISKENKGIKVNKLKARPELKKY